MENFLSPECEIVSLYSKETRGSAASVRTLEEHRCFRLPFG